MGLCDIFDKLSLAPKTPDNPLNISSGDGNSDKVIKSSDDSSNSLNSSHDSSGIVETPQRHLTSTPVKEVQEPQTVSFLDSRSPILNESGKAQDSDQIPEQQQSNSASSYDWYGLPAPMFGTMVPNRIFVGGISPQTSENDLTVIFSAYGNVRATKIISDRAGVSKGYGFVTFETEHEARSLCDGIANKEMEPIVIRERRLNIAPAVKKQQKMSECEYGYPSAPPSPSPYVSAAYYMSQANASQYYYHAVPMHEQFYPPEAGYGPPGHYYTAMPPPPAPMYCMTEQFQCPPPNYPPPNFQVPCYVQTMMTPYPPSPPLPQQPQPQFGFNGPNFYSGPPPHIMEAPPVSWPAPPGPAPPNCTFMEAFEPSPYYSTTCAY